MMIMFDSHDRVIENGSPIRFTGENPVQCSARGIEIQRNGYALYDDKGFYMAIPSPLTGELLPNGLRWDYDGLPCFDCEVA